MDRGSSSPPGAVQGREGLHDRVRVLYLSTSRDVGAPAVAVLPTTCERHLGPEPKVGGGGAHKDARVAWRCAKIRECHVSSFRGEGAEIGPKASPCVQDDHRGGTILRHGRSFPIGPGRRRQRIPAGITESRKISARARDRKSVG